MIPYLKWLILTSICTIVITVTEVKYQSLQILAEADSSFISYGIWALTVFGIFYCLYCIWAKQSYFKRVQELTEICMRLGLLGTVIGLVMTMYALDFSNEDYKQDMTVGIITGLTSTVTGIIGSLILSTYTLFLKEYK